MRSYRGRSSVGWSAGEFLLIGLLRISHLRGSEKFFVANLATAAATHSSRQDGGNTIAEELPSRSVLEPLIGRTRG